MNTVKSPALVDERDFNVWYEQAGGQPGCLAGKPTHYPCIAIMFFGSCYFEREGPMEVVQNMDYVYFNDFKFGSIGVLKRDPSLAR